MMHTISSVKFHTEDGSVIRIISSSGENVVLVGQALLHNGLADWLRAGGEIAPYYTIVSAEFANADGTAVRALTSEAGELLITQSPGKADRWAALEKWVSTGGKIAPFTRSLEPETARIAQ
jgi:hypothetical protein